MKKAGIFTVLFACFALMFTLPTAVFAHNGATDSTLVANTATGGDGNTLTEDINQGYRNMKNGANRAMNRVENDVDRIVDDGRDGSAYHTNSVNRNNYRLNATTTAATNRTFNWGWLGLIGLIGLAGMRGRDRGRA